MLDKQECDICGEMISPAGMSNHKSFNHSDVPKTVNYQICGQAVSRYNLIAHKKTHTEDKIKCQYCPVFLLTSSMWKHNYLKHPNGEISTEDNKVQCQFCNLKLLPISMRQHIYLKHPNGEIVAHENRVLCQFCTLKVLPVSMPKHVLLSHPDCEKPSKKQKL